MAKKDSTATTANNNRNVNTNNNVNNTTVNNHNHIVIPESLVKPSAKKSNWLAKALIGGIITIAVSLAIFYGKQNLTGKNNPNVSTQDTPVKGTKQN